MVKLINYKKDKTARDDNEDEIACLFLFAFENHFNLKL